MIKIIFKIRFSIQENKEIFSCCLITFIITVKYFETFEQCLPHSVGNTDSSEVGVVLSRTGSDGGNEWGGGEGKGIQIEEKTLEQGNLKWKETHIVNMKRPNKSISNSKKPQQYFLAYKLKYIDRVPLG